MNLFNKNKKNIFSKLQKYLLIGACAFFVFFVAKGINAAPDGNTTATGSLPGATTNATVPTQTVTTPNTPNTTPTNPNAAANVANSSSSGEGHGWTINPIKNLLYAIFTFVNWLFLIAVIIFDWILKPENFKLFLDSPAVREIWVMVRDFLNIGFIFFLLFSAFATIFQIEKYHIKSMIFKLILMALLVNFSFPISRFIIDVSNVTMYWLLNNIFDNMKGGAGIIATLAGDTGIAHMLLPDNADSEIARIIAATAFLFIFGITMLIIGVMFVIRLIALSILVMFSSIGFVAAAFPLTSKYASSWWDSLFKYSFFAPIMVFGMAIAIKLMNSIGDRAQDGMRAAANNQVVPGLEPGFIAQGAFFAIPVIVLWATMGIAQKLSIAGAGAVTGQGQKLAKWAGANVTGISFAKNAYKAYEGRRSQANADKLSNRLGNWAGGKPDQLMGALGSKRADQRYQSGLSAQVADAAKLHDMTNKTENELKNVAQSGNKFAQAAAMMELASRGRTNKTEELDQIRAKFGEDSQVFRQMQNKVKAYDPASAFAHIADDKERQERIKEHVNSNQFDAKKLNADALGNAEFLGITMENGSIKPGDLDDLAKKSAIHAKNIKNSLATIADQDKLDVNGNVMRDAGGNAVKKYANMMDENSRNIQMAYMAAHGNAHSSLKSKAQRAELFKRLNKDNAKNIKEGTITGAHGEEMIRHVNIGNFKEIVSNMKSDEAKQAFVDRVKAMPAGDPKRIALEKQIQQDPFLVGFW